MRIVSLLPAATEIVSALGASASLVGVSHECDWPSHVTRLPRVTRTAITCGSTASAEQVDAEVRERARIGAPLFTLVEDEIAAMAPDVVLTQALCDVCAIREDDVRALAARLRPSPKVVSLFGATLSGVLADIAFIAGAIERADSGERLIESIRARLRTVHDALSAAEAPRPRLAVLEWTDPVFSSGHWVPDLIHRAGGIDVLARAGDRSRTVTPAEVREAAPDVLIVAPCGYSLDRAVVEGHALLAREEWEWAREVPIWALDGNGLTSRGGPRLADAVEVLAAIMHPALFDAPAAWGAASRIPIAEHRSRSTLSLVS